MRVRPTRHAAKLVPDTRCEARSDGKKQVARFGPGTLCNAQLLCDQVTGVPRKHQIVDLLLIARAKVDHFVDLNKMVGLAVAIDLKITKIEKRNSAPGRERLRSLLTVGVSLSSWTVRLVRMDASGQAIPIASL